MSSPSPSSHRRGPGRPASGSEAEKTEVREQLLDAAQSLAIERGLDGAGIREIAERAGVSSGMISYYFGDRRGLHEAMFQRAFERMSEQFRQALEAQGERADLLETLLRIHTSALAADPWLPRLIAREVLGREGDFRNRFVELAGAGPLELMRSTIEAGVASGKLRAGVDPILCMLTIAGLSAFPYLAGPLLGEMMGFELDDDFRDRLVEHNIQLIANGLRAPASSEELS